MRRSSSAWKRIGHGGRGLAPLEAEQRHGDGPAVVDAADHVRPSGTSASVKKTSLNSDSPEIILIGRTSTPGWRMSTSRNADPLVLRCVGVGAGEHEDVVGEVAGGRPDLLPVDDPLVAVEHGPAAEVAEVGAGVGLGVALAPQVLAGEDAGQVVAPSARRSPTSAACCRASGCRRRRWSHRSAPRPWSNSSARITCSSARQPRAAVLLRPAGRQVAVLVERVAPLADERAPAPRPRAGRCRASSSGRCSARKAWTFSR